MHKSVADETNQIRFNYNRKTVHKLMDGQAKLLKGNPPKLCIYSWGKREGRGKKWKVGHPCSKQKIIVTKYAFFSGKRKDVDWISHMCYFDVVNMTISNFTVYFRLYSTFTRWFLMKYILQNSNFLSPFAWCHLLPLPHPLYDYPCP